MDESLKSFIGVKWSIALSPQLSFWTKQYTHCIRRKYPTNFLLLFFSNTLIFYEEVHIFMVIFLPIENFHFLPDFSRQKNKLLLRFRDGVCRTRRFLSLCSCKLWSPINNDLHIFGLNIEKKTLITLTYASVVVASSWNKWSSGRCSGFSLRSVSCVIGTFLGTLIMPLCYIVGWSGWSVCLSVIVSLKGREDTPRSTCLRTE